MDPSDAAEMLGRALRERRLAVLAGARASAPTADATGRPYEGLPTPTEFVELCAAQIGYVDRRDDFVTACDKVLDRDGRAKLEELLLRYYRVPDAFQPPPAHRMLAWLPFSLYLTSNFDEFLERALEREGRFPYRLVDNADLVRLRQWHTPVVKYHGCVTRPATMVAATADFRALEEERSLVQDYVAAHLAGKHLLVVGHGLADSDLARILKGLADRLGEYNPSVFVLRPAEHDGRLPGLTFPAEAVTEDLTQFLSRLLHQARQPAPDTHSRGTDELWLSSAFFATLRQAATLPSETQVIDAFLHHLQEEIGARTDVEDVLADADVAVNLALQVRPNYEAVRKTWADVTELLRPLRDTAEAESALQHLQEKRAARINAFRHLGTTLVGRNERVLLYSQSQRVAQVLLGVPQAIQKTIHLFIAECRPKSPLPYQDATAICNQLAGTFYAITVCPDVVAGHLLRAHQIDRVVMGTHAVFVDEEGPYAFVNTCGSGMLAQAARRFGVAVDVVGEELKLERVARLEARDHIHIHEENDLLESAVGLRDISTRRASVEHLNIGYDLVDLEEGITVYVPDAPTK